QLNKDIQENKKQKQESEKDLKELKKIIGKMMAESKDRTRYDLLHKEKEGLEKIIDRLKQKNRDELEHLLSEIPIEGIKNKLNACIINFDGNIKEYEKKVKTLTTKKTQMESNLKSTQQDIENKEKEIRELDKEIRDTCVGDDLDGALEKSKTSMEDCNKLVGELQASEAVYTRYTEKLKKDDCCPLCHRDFSSKSDTEDLIEELEMKVKTVPTRLADAKEKLSNQERHNDKLIQLKPKRERTNRIKREVEGLKVKEENFLKNLTKVAEELDSQFEILNMTQSDVEMARKIQDDVSKIDEKLKRVKQINDEIEDLQVSLGSTGMLY
ncbi:unnamed protein product, partial [Meganyctiphanes norvegica]